MCCTIILNIFIIVIIGCPILNCMIHYNVCNDKGNSVGQWKLLWAVGSGNHTSPPGYWLKNLSAHPAVLFIVRSRLLLYFAGSGVNRVQVVLSGFSMRLFSFVQAKTVCMYGCMYFLAALVLVCVDV